MFWQILGFAFFQTHQDFLQHTKMRFWPLGPTCATGGSAPRESSVPSSMLSESVVKSRARNCKSWKMRRERADKRCHDVEPWERAYMRRSLHEKELSRRNVKRDSKEMSRCQDVSRGIYILCVYIYTIYIYMYQYQVINIIIYIYMYVCINIINICICYYEY